MSNTKKLYRSETNKVIAGVCGGMGEYFDIDPVLVRVIWLLLVIFGGGGLLAYFICWLIIPTKSNLKDDPSTGDTIKNNVVEMKATAKDAVEKVKEAVKSKKEENK